jgi:TPP-dependent pyruvate/acetoin dehydrogenase alpha subunit
MLAAYEKAVALAEQTQQPAIVVCAHPRACVAFDAVTAEDYRTNPGRAQYFDTVEPTED